MDKKMDNKQDKDFANTSDKSTSKGGVADRVGDALEKVGHKISDAGAPGLGKKIHDAGDSLEKSHDNPNHPHDV